MAENKGKKFEQVIKESIERVPTATVDRIPDQVTKFKGSSNICDFIAYCYPHQYYLECKSVHGNTLSISSVPKLGKDGELHGFYGNIRDNQWEGLLEKSKCYGVVAGVICWWIDKDITLFLPIQTLKQLYDEGHKSVRYDAYTYNNVLVIGGEKKRVYFDYDMETFFEINKH